MQISRLYQLFKDKDATLIEVNPLCETSYGTIMCLDSKLNFDDSSLFRHPEIEKLDDPTQYEPRDLEAKKADLNFISLDGDIGCLVNGAGLAMATLDLISLYGGQPANFLDIGGGAKKEQVTEAIKIISSDPKVKSILINIFGGIMRCDIVALGLLSAARELNLKVPLVVRLQGTNVKEAKQIMADSGLQILASENLDDAARMAVKVAEIAKLTEGTPLQGFSFQLPHI